MEAAIWSTRLALTASKPATLMQDILWDFIFKGVVVTRGIFLDIVFQKPELAMCSSHHNLTKVVVGKYSTIR